ncbi:MAG: hypothetical protein RR436_03195 [Clostridia bacterium]
MAGYLNTYYQNKAERQKSELLKNKLLSLEKVLKDSNDKLLKLDYKKDILKKEKDQGVKRLDQAAKVNMAEKDEVATVSAKKNEVSGVLKGLGSSGNAKREKELIEGNANVLKSRILAKNFEDKLRYDLDYLNKNEGLENDIKATKKAYKDDSDSINTKYKNGIDKIINDIVSEQERYKANLYRSVITSWLKKNPSMLN